MQTFNYIFTILFLFSTLTFADVSGTSIKGATPNTYLIEGFNEVASAAGTTTLTKDSQTKQILTGTTTQTYVLPSATTIPLSRKFLFINKSTGLMTIQTSGGGALTTVSAGSQKEVHLRAAGSAAGTWDVLNTGGVWGSISGTLGAQTDLQAALDAKTDKSTLTTKGDIYAATGAGVITRLGVSGNNGYVLTEDSAEPTGFKWAASSGGGGGVWGGITGILSNQTDLQAALDLKAPLASPTFSGTITTPLTASRAMVTTAGSALGVSATTATELGYLSGTTSAVQTQLDAKQARSTLTTKGDLYVATASATVARQGVGSDGQVLMSDSTQTNGIKWATPPGDNLIYDGNAEFGTTNFVEGSYSAATRPSGTFTPSSGSGTFAISTSSSSPLFGSNSFLLTKSSGASRQGRAIERTIAIDSGYRTKMLKTRIDYTIVSGTFVAGSNGSSPTDSSLIWYVGQYNGSTWTYTEPSTFKMFSNSTTNSDWVEGEFQVNSDTTQLKLIGFISESANSAWVVKAEVGFRLSTYLAGTTITDWVSYTPGVTQGFGSVGSVNLQSRRVGDTLQVRGRWTNGTVNTSEARLSLGYGGVSGNVTIDASKITATQPVGSYLRNLADTSVVTYYVLAQTGGLNYVNFSRQTSAATPITLATGAEIADSTTGVSAVQFEVPIQGWSSSTQQSDGYDGRFIGMRYTNSAGTAIGTSAAVLPYPTLVYDSTSSYNTSTGLYTCPATRYYNVQASFTTAGVSLTTTQGVDLYIRLNGTDVDRRLVLGNGASANYNANLPTTVYCQAGQTIGVYAVSSVATTTVTLANLNVLSIEAVQAPTTISATEFVGMSYSNTAGTTFTGTFSNVPFATKSYDSHNAWNGTDTYTCPIAGFYSVQAAINFTFGAYTAGHYAELNVTKNASTLVYANTWGANATVSNYLGLTASTVVQCNAGETIKLTCRNDASRALNTGAGYNTITITRIK